MRLCTLATLELRESAAGPVLLGPGKPTAVLAFLAGAPRRSAPRHALSALIWADLEPDAAKHALRQALWYLKKKAGTELVVSDGDTLQLADIVSIDRDELIEASRVGDHQRVVDLYPGPFIPNFAAPGGAGFEEWAALERRRLLEVFRHSAESVITRYVSSGQARDGVALARRLRDQDVYNESGWRLLVEVCLSANDFLAARSEAEALLALTDREEIELEPATQAVLRVTRSGAAREGAASEQPIHPSLVGRQAAFASLLDAWEHARTRRLTRVHITARAGIGKTRLLRDFSARLRAMRAKLVTTGGSIGVRSIEFAAMSDLASGLAALPGKHAIAAESAATLVDLNPSLSTFFDRPGKAPARHDLLRTRALALRELLRAVSFEHPVALLVDDLHWWDEASLACLAAMLESAGDSRVLLVTAGRPEVQGTALAGALGTRHIALEPLSAPQIEELLQSVASIPGDPWAQAFASGVWKASRGSPLLVLELLQHLEQSGLLARESGTWITTNAAQLDREIRERDVMQTRIGTLDRGDLWLLTVLAIAGAPITELQLAESVSRTAHDVKERLQVLEARGLVARTQHSVGVAHDEIGEEALRAASADAIRKGATALGRTLGAGMPLSEHQLRRAAQLLRSANDRAGLAEVFRRFAGHRFGLGDRRSVSVLASEVLGASARPDDIDQLRTATPLSWRLGIVSPARRFAAAVALVLGGAAAAGVALRPSVPVPADAILGLVLLDSLGNLSYEVVDIRSGGWAPQDTLTARAWSGPPVRLHQSSTFNIDYSERTGALAMSQAVPDSGIIDLFLYAPDSAPRRLAPAKGDDGAPAFSPDGRFLAFSTARWSSLSRYDIALLDLETNQVRQITSGASSDGSPIWSLDGSRVTFARSNWGYAPNEVCTHDLATASLSCFAGAAAEDLVPLRWLDRDRLVVGASNSLRRRLSIVQWSAREQLPLFESAMRSSSLSPDGAWLYCDCAQTPEGDLGPAIIPMAAPHLVRPVRLSRRNGRVLREVFWIRSTVSLPAVSLTIEPLSTADAGVPSQLRATLRDARGNELANRGSVRWNVIQGSAVIDSITGIMVADGRSPSVTVLAKSGAMARDSLVLPVRTAEARLLFDEHWFNFDRWMTYGLPLPILDSTAHGREMLNNGEGSYESGVLSRTTAVPDSGVALDVVVRTPITLPQWQVLLLSVTGRDVAPYRNASASNATPYAAIDAELCDLGYPPEGRIAGPAPLMSIAIAGVGARLRVPDLNSGEPWTLRLQLFPDGRCGVAINGKPLGILNARHRPIPVVRLRLGGNSYQTRIAVGRLRFYEGVLTDVDWAKAPVLK